MKFPEMKFLEAPDPVRMIPEPLLPLITLQGYTQLSDGFAPPMIFPSEFPLM
jgi:hypothetical protein